MANEFSAHRVQFGGAGSFIIATPINLYVAKGGNDTLNSGIESGSPFLTPERAFQWLNDKIITDSGFVTINIGPGTYDIGLPLEMSHPQGNRIAIIGAEPEILLLQYVSDYVTRSFSTEPGKSGFYSGVLHGITMNCVRPSENTYFEPIGTANGIKDVCGVSGCGVLIEDYSLQYSENNLIYAEYASYPRQPRNNLTRQGSILGCHKLHGVSFGNVRIESSIRDDWFVLPQVESPTDTGRFYGNAVIGQTYANGVCANPSDTTETQTNAWLIPISNNQRGHFISSVPVGYYGTTLSTGIPVGATSNFIGLTFPTGSTYAGFTTMAAFGSTNNTGITIAYSFTGPNGSMLNSSVAFGPNYHQHVEVNGRLGIGSSAGWRSVNSGLLAVTILPTVLRRNGTILKIRNSGLRKIKNIFFDGVGMPSFYALLGYGSHHQMRGVSVKSAIEIESSDAGIIVDNEPLYSNESLGSGLCSGVGIKDFQVGVLATRSSNVVLGIAAISNCAYGVLSNYGSTIRTSGSIATGCMHGFYATNNSTMETNRCFSSFSGQSLLELIITNTAGQTFDQTAFNPGQTFQSGPIIGTVYHWDPSILCLTIAVKNGAAEGRRVF